MQDYTEDVYYSINQSKETGGKVVVAMSYNKGSFRREIIYANIKGCKDSLENDIAIFIADAKELFPTKKEPDEQTQSIRGSIL